MTAACAGAPVHAQGKLEARYTVTIAGIPIGRGSWNADIGEDHYVTGASGRVTGILRAVTNGEGSAGARGLISAGRLMTTSYAVNLTADNRPDAIRMALNGGAVKDLVAEPPTPFAPDRVPITDAHVRGVVDPLTAGLIPMGASGDMLSPEACHRTLPIFDGRQRYDLVLSFKRMERVRAERGYQGPAVVCMVVYQPLAGHRPERAAIRHLAQSRDMEIALAPVAGTRVLAPFRILIPTLIGPAVLQATQFVSVAQATRPTSAKIQ